MSRAALASAFFLACAVQAHVLQVSVGESRGMERPYIKFFTRDWIDDFELRQCPPLARAVLIDLMCLANEGTPRGYLTNSRGPLPEKFIANRCHISVPDLRRAMAGLLENGRLKVSEEGFFFIGRMVRDEEIRQRRAAGGAFSINKSTLRKGGVNGTLTPPPSSVKEGGVEYDSVLCTSSSEAQKGSAGGKPNTPDSTLTAAFLSLKDLWLQPCDVCITPHGFSWTGEDEGARGWISLVSDGTVTRENVASILDGLTRWRASKEWHRDGGKYVPRVANWLGFSRNGKPANRAWLDYPEPLGEWEVS